MHKQIGILSWACVYLFALCANTTASEEQAAELSEPNAEISSRWWPEFENVWTPVGWKDHFLRANVVYNGMVVIEPKKKPYKGKGIQLEFVPSNDGVIPKPLNEYYPLARKYGPTGNQGWNKGPAPVLWTQWNQDGLTLRKEIFGHVAGAGNVGKDVEPLYFWIRLSIRELNDNQLTGKYYWLIKINKPHLGRTMRRTHNLVVSPKTESTYPHGLQLESPGKEFQEGCRLVEEDGKIRLGIAPGPRCKVDWIDQRPGLKDVYLRIEMPTTRGTYVDFLLPALPVDKAPFDAEFQLGRDQALAQTDRYWAQVPQTAARVDTPEPLINETIRHNVKFTELLALRMPETGQYCQTSGSWHYEQLWITPTSMTHTMILDVLGYHSVSEKYLEVFKDNQGVRVPPSKWFKQHPGYFSTPRSMTSIDWLSDHGAALHAVCNHALMTGDKEFIDHWTDSIVKACEFIRDSIAIKGHGGVEGILPPAVATDRQELVQAVWSDGWNYKGLTTAVRLLQRTGHPRAEEFTGVATEYKNAHNRAFRELARKTEQWTDRAGESHRYMPTLLSGQRKELLVDQGRRTVTIYDHPFYLDTGPMFLVFAGLMDADDPLMKEAVEFFRNGPNAFDMNGNHALPPSLHHELSSCEPCYSWNVMHSHQLGDRHRFLEGMYSMFAGSLSRQTFICSETRGGISGTVFSAPLAIFMARLAVIDDQIEPGKLHLLRTTPLAWLRNDRETAFERMPSEFGPISLRFKLVEQSQSLKVSFEPRFRTHPEGITLHIPPLESLHYAIVNGERHSIHPGGILQIQ